MYKKEDKYKESAGEHRSQIRSIIGKINDEKPSQEKSREQKVRPDGSRELRIVRRRRVSISEKDKRKNAIHRFIRSFFFAIVCFILAIAYFLYQFFMMSGESYLNAQAEKFKEAWGLQSIELSGASISGFELRVESLVIKFTAKSMFSKLELSGLSADLTIVGMVRNMIMADELHVKKANLILKEGADQLSLDEVANLNFCQFDRITCPQFSLYFGGLESSPIAIKNASAYIYKIKEQSKDATENISNQISCSFDSGKFIVKDWKEFTINNILARVSSSGVHNLRATLLLPEYTSSHSGKTRPKMQLKTSIANGASLFGPYDFSSSNMSFDDISANRLSSILSARLAVDEDSEYIEDVTRSLSFSPNGGDPSFTGTFNLVDITWSGLTAISHLLKHIEADRRTEYIKIFISKAHVELKSTKNNFELSFTEADMNEPYLASLAASIKIDAESKISGFINYGIPFELTRAEYPDGISDPIFREDDKLAWLETRLKGKSSVVHDNSNELDTHAQEARKLRPKPADLNRVNVDIVSKRVMENFSRRHNALNTGKTRSSSEIENTSLPEAIAAPEESKQVENKDEVLMPLSPTLF